MSDSAVGAHHRETAGTPINPSVPPRSCALSRARRWSPAVRGGTSVCDDGGGREDALRGARAGGASRGEIKAAYQRLARKVHPNAADEGGDEGFIRLHAAYATLADPRSACATTVTWPAARRR